ncbi:hypothetical protein [Agitococcus lubricus]|uniref:Lipocalin-like protein n=1 Tax=Agitococcus lubricus TaxID=1077255 RepID=A0A2T5IX07_9GAMM|nr:hypothetical protein [Agitococcus lubricus]PTQ88380.1 hypothetical protein C8N29_11225 [Agitococcus lubricus]
MRAVYLSVSLWVSAIVHADSLVGYWTTQWQGETLTLQLDADGTGLLNQQQIRYATQANVLWVETSAGLSSYYYQLQQGKLSLQGGDLTVPMVLVRSKKTQAIQKNTTGTKQTHLVGKWCWLSAFSANTGGGSTSSRCFVLEANGRYSYQDESSTEAYGGGMWGGTHTQHQDSGQWSLNNHTMTARSDTGQVTEYRVELKNHPKNRDPMICLDGECYVSFYQKAPW